MSDDAARPTGWLTRLAPADQQAFMRAMLANMQLREKLGAVGDVGVLEMQMTDAMDSASWASALAGNASHMREQAALMLRMAEGWEAMARIAALAED